MNTQNHSFINKNCDICGKSELVLSTLNLCCNYESQNDGEELTLKVCGTCTDKIYNFIKQNRGDKNNNCSKSKGH